MKQELSYILCSAPSYHSDNPVDRPKLIQVFHIQYQYCYHIHSNLTAPHKELHLYTIEPYHDLHLSNNRILVHKYLRVQEELLLKSRINSPRKLSGIFHLLHNHNIHHKVIDNITESVQSL